MQSRAHSPFSDRQYNEAHSAGPAVPVFVTLPLGPDWDTVDFFHFHFQEKKLFYQMR